MSDPLHPVSRLEESATAAPGAVIVPGLAPFAPALWPLVAHLPMLDVNGALRDALASRAPFAQPAPVAAVFACDPFLRVADMAATLRRAGIVRVINWPSIQAHQGESAAALAAVGYRAEAEFRTLLAFAVHGLQPLAFVTTAAAADAALAMGLRRLVLPQGESWTELASHVAIEGGEALAWSDAPPQTARPSRRIRL